MAKVNGHIRSPGYAGTSEPEVLESYVLRCYPDWYRWSLPMRVAIAMLDRYADAAALLAAEGLPASPDASESAEGEAGGTCQGSFYDAVRAFYELGRQRPCFEKSGSKAKHVLSEAQVMRVIEHDRLMSAVRSYVLGNASAEEVRLLKMGGWFERKRPRSSARRAATPGKQKSETSTAAKSNGDLSRAWPSSRGVLD